MAQTVHLSRFINASIVLNEYSNWILKLGRKKIESSESKGIQMRWKPVRLPGRIHNQIAAHIRDKCSGKDGLPLGKCDVRCVHGHCDLWHLLLHSGCEPKQNALEFQIKQMDNTDSAPRRTHLNGCRRAASYCFDLCSMCFQYSTNSWLVCVVVCLMLRKYRSACVKFSAKCLLSSTVDWSAT